MGGCDISRGSYPSPPQDSLTGMWEEAAVTGPLLSCASLVPRRRGVVRKVLGRQRDEKGTGPERGRRGSNPRVPRRTPRQGEREKHPLSPPRSPNMDAWIRPHCDEEETTPLDNPTTREESREQAVAYR